MKRTTEGKVRLDIDLRALPPLTDKQRADLEALASKPDNAIDYSDLPPSSPQGRVERGRFYKPLKQQITTRVDADVLDWLKSGGGGYQARMNAILRREMLSAIKGKQRA